MPTSPFEKYRSQVNKFNQKFGLNFSFEAYETSKRRINDLASFFTVDGRISPENNIYRGALLNLYRESVDNAINKKSDLLDQAELIKDFEKLVDNYREYCKEKNKKAPSEFGGWKNSVAIVKAMRQEIGDIKPKKSDYIKDQYLAGKFPLRNMSADLKTIKNSDPPSAEDLSRTIVYARALHKVIRERSFWRKANPFNWIRNSAEKRDLKALNDYIVRVGEENPKLYNKAEKFAEENVIERAKASLDKSIESIRNREQQKKEG